MIGWRNGAIQLAHVWRENIRRNVASEETSVMLTRESY
jgi:hypothetical protein